MGGSLAISRDGHQKQKQQSVKMYNWDLSKKSIVYYLLFMNCFKKALRQAFLCWKLLSPKAVLLVHSSRTYVDKKKSEYSSTL